MSKTPKGGKPWTRTQLVELIVQWHTDDYAKRDVTPEFSLDDIELAIGILMTGHIYGYQAIRICHTHRTLKKVESLLGVELREVLPDRTQLSTKIRGVRLADGFAKFWQAVASGSISATEAKVIEPA